MQVKVGDSGKATWIQGIQGSQSIQWIQNEEIMATCIRHTLQVVAGMTKQKRHLCVSPFFRSVCLRMF